MISESLTLPCGALIRNRLCKAAMTEGLADPQGQPTEALNQLYDIWSQGGAGLLLSGNVQIDGDHLERPGNVIVDSEPSVAMQVALERWAAAGTRTAWIFVFFTELEMLIVGRACLSRSVLRR